MSSNTVTGKLDEAKKSRFAKAQAHKQQQEQADKQQPNEATPEVKKEEEIPKVIPFKAFMPSKPPDMTLTAQTSSTSMNSAHAAVIAQQEREARMAADQEQFRAQQIKAAASQQLLLQQKHQQQLLRQKQAQAEAQAAQAKNQPSIRDINKNSEVLGKRKLNALLQQVAPGESLLPETEDLLLELVDDFIESTTEFAAKLALHRGSTQMDAKDVKLHLEKNWQIHVPGFGADSARALRKPDASAHQRRLAAVQRTMARSKSARK